MRKKKTALMQAIEKTTAKIEVLKLRADQFRLEKDYTKHNMTLSIISEIVLQKQMLQQLLETEKQDLIEAHECGFTHYDAGYKLDGQQWFNEKYENDGE